MMHPFNLGIPDFDSVIFVEGYGVCQLRRFYENGDVLIYIGSGRNMRIDGSTNWRYAR